MVYLASPNRYKTMAYRRVKNTGIQLPALSLGLWQNFDSLSPFENTKKMCFTAFDHGICSFDLANLYGKPLHTGAEEETFGRILANDFKPYRDELFISTKAGLKMWEGPYGDWGSKKHLLASLDQSLKRLQIDYVDVFYSHRPDPETPLEETIEALLTAIQTGKALYVGLSNYNSQDMKKAVSMLAAHGVHCFANQVKYSILNQEIEQDFLPSTAEELGVSLITFSPLAQGVLTDRYLHGIPEDSRVNKSRSLKREELIEEKLAKIIALNNMAIQRGQSLSNLALAWVLRNPIIASTIIGASKPEQILDALNVLKNHSLSDDELKRIQETITSN